MPIPPPSRVPGSSLPEDPLVHESQHLENETAEDVPDEVISNLLVRGLQASSQTLSIYSGTVKGGVAAMPGTLQIMYDGLLANMDPNPPTTDLENMFQLALMDIMSHKDEYGMSQDSELLKNISFLLTYTGSGQHSNWIDTLSPPGGPRYYYTGGDKVQSYKKIYDDVIFKIKAKIADASIPSNSITGKSVLFIYDNNRTGIGDGLISPAYYSGTGQGWITPNLNTLSPLIRSVVYAAMLKENPNLSPDDAKIILNGTKDLVDALTQKQFKKNAINVVLAQPGGWRNQQSNVTYPIDRDAEAAANAAIAIANNNLDTLIGQFNDKANSLNAGSAQKYTDYMNDYCDGSYSKLVQDPTFIADSAYGGDNTELISLGPRIENAKKALSDANKVEKTERPLPPLNATAYFDFEDGLNSNAITNLFTSIPARQLNDAEIKEVNRTLDNTEVLYKLLKIWLEKNNEQRKNFAANI